MELGFSHEDAFWSFDKHRNWKCRDDWFTSVQTETIIANSIAAGIFLVPFCVGGFILVNYLICKNKCQ